MKKLSQYIFILAVIGFSGYSIYLVTLPACSKPLKYSIGRFDTQFGVSQEEFKLRLAEAEKTWEAPLRRDVFAYDPEADFKVNLIYDERQIATIQKQKTEFGLSAAEETFKKLDGEFAVFKNQYERKTAAYEQALNAFNEMKSAYDKEVSFWNSHGGAPKEQYASLEEERRKLNAEADRLNNEVASINQMSKELNSLLEIRNRRAAEYNKIADEYNKKYNEGLEFNQAEYTGKEINVYQFGDKKDLMLALSHELGHALGMDHVENPGSIMYYITTGETESLIAPSEEDLAELNKVCK